MTGKETNNNDNLYQKYQQWIEANRQLEQITTELNGLFVDRSERLSLVEAYRDWAYQVEKLTDELNKANAWELVKEEPF